MKIYHDKGLRQLFTLVALLSCLFPAINLLLIYPRYQAQMLETVQHEARRVAHHLTRQARFENGNLLIDLNEKDDPFTLSDFGLLEVKVFDQRGAVVYATEKAALGTTNDQPHFKEVIAHGQEFSQVITKDEQTADGKTTHRHLVETYLPILQNGAVAGAFELYYDISQTKADYNRIYLLSFIFPIPLMFLLIALFGFILKRLDAKITERRHDQVEIETQRNALLIEGEKQRQLLLTVENAKRQWEATMDRVDDMVLLTDAARRVQRCNQAFASFSGRPFTEIIGQPLSALLDDGETVLTSEPGKPFDYFHAASGRWFTAAVYPTSLRGEEPGLVLTMHDMTAMKQVTAELEQKNQETLAAGRELQRAIDEISNLIQRVGEEEDFGAYFNNDLPLSCHEFMHCGKTDCPAYGKEKSRCWQEAGTFCGGKVQGVFAQKFKSCAECKYFKTMTANPINMIGEQFNNMMHVLESKNRALQTAYSELKQAQSHLLQQEKMASIGQLAAGVAHEINNPVGFISSNLNSLHKYGSRLAEFITLEAELVGQTGDEALVARQNEGKKKYKIDFVLQDINDLVRESLEGCDRVKTIVQNLKSFSRIDQATRQTVDIHECLDSTINIVWNELKYKAKVIKDYHAATPITCFPQQLNQVFMNLLVNAAHAIDKEGLITIKTWQDEASLSVAITDTGIGIAPENLSHIFEPFFTTKEVGKGTGLGLSIVYDIVNKNHHGNILVDSKLGAGTTFTVQIPFTTKG